MGAAGHYREAVPQSVHYPLRSITLTLAPKLKLREMGSRYRFICLYVWLEKYFSRGDYRKRVPLDQKTGGASLLLADRDVQHCISAARQQGNERGQPSSAADESSAYYAL